MDEDQDRWVTTAIAFLREAANKALKAGSRRLLGGDRVLHHAAFDEVPGGVFANHPGEAAGGQQRGEMAPVERHGRGNRGVEG